MYTDIKIGFKPIGYNDNYIERRLSIELERIEIARKKRNLASLNSFVNWMRNTIAKVGRAFGYHILIPRIKIVRLYKWLFE